MVLMLILILTLVPVFSLRPQRLCGEQVLLLFFFVFTRKDFLRDLRGLRGKMLLTLPLPGLNFPCVPVLLQNRGKSCFTQGWPFVNSSSPPEFNDGDLSFCKEKVDINLKVVFIRVIRG